MQHLQRLPDEFQSLMYYDYQLLGSRFMGVPFATDVRLLGFNVTTFLALGLELPPPYGRSDWTWENLRDTACALFAHRIFFFACVTFVGWGGVGMGGGGDVGGGRGDGGLGMGGWGGGMSRVLFNYHFGVARMLCKL